MGWQVHRWPGIAARSLVAGAIVLALSGGGAAGTSVQEQAATPSADAFTPLVATVLAVPHSVPSTDGRVHCKWGACSWT